MPTFEPPTVQQGAPGDLLFSRYSVPVGQSVVRKNGVFVTDPYPWLGDLTGLVDGVDYFLGGHKYDISNTIAIELDAAGFTVTDWPLRDYFVTLLPNRDNTPVKIAVIGDSISEGAVAGTWTAEWRLLLQTQLRTIYPVTGVPTPGIGYIPAIAVTGSPSTPVTISGTPGSGFVDYGLGLKRYRVNNTQYVEWNSQQCDAVRVWYGRNNFLAGDGIVSIDGVDKVTLDGSDAVNVGGLVWDSGPLTPGGHVVRVRGLAGFGFTLEACEFYNGDKDKGVHVYDAAHFGATVNTFLAAGADTGHWQSLATLNPHVVLVNLGTNDIINFTPTAFKDNLTTLVGKIRAAAPDSAIVFVKGWRYPPRSQYTWDAFRAAIDSVSAATTKSTVYDLAAHWPALVADGSTSQGLMYESVNPLHPNAAGHQRYADLMTGLLS